MSEADAKRVHGRDAAARAIEDFLRAIGRDPAREPELVGTGRRVADAFLDELCDGYDVDVGKLLTDNTIAGTSDVVIVRDIAVTTTCPHHLLPAFGTARVAYAPRTKLVGIGTIVRLVDAFAHRLTLQEAIGEEVVRAISVHLEAAWAGCRLEMTHGCMAARGERRHGARVETVALAGATEDATRAIAHRALGVGE
jgi:GTP cyclohydrolase I